MTRTAPIGVSFNDPEEFLTELRQDRDRLDRAILRVTATVTIDGMLVKLDHRVGDAFAGDEKANGLMTKTQALLEKLTGTGKALGLEVRAGVYE